jgi:hypothetical protein
VSAARRWWLTNLATLGGSRFQVSPGKQTKKKRRKRRKEQGLLDSISREKSWAWWCEPIIPITSGNLKQMVQDGQDRKHQEPISKITRV